MKDVILPIMDALRADHVSWDDYLRDTKLFLDEFSQRGMVFEAAHAASTQTRETLSALLTGRHSIETVPYNLMRGAETVLNEYATAAFRSVQTWKREARFTQGGVICENAEEIWDNFLSKNMATPEEVDDCHEFESLWVVLIEYSDRPLDQDPTSQDENASWLNKDIRLEGF